MDLDKIAKKYSRAKVDKCADQGCRLKTKIRSNFLILKGEIVDPSNKMCDCLMFGRDDQIVLVELKHSVQHADKIVKKFEQSIIKSLSIASETDSKTKHVTLVLLSKRYAHPTEYITISTSRLRHAGVEYRIATGQCGDFLNDFID